MENLLHIKVGVIDTLTDDDEIHYEDFQLPPEAMLSEILTQLGKKYPGHIFINNNLAELQDDDILGDIFEDGDVLTAFRTGHNKERAQLIKNNSDAIVVLVDKNGKPMFIKSGTEEKYKWKMTDFDRIITVFRKVVEKVVDGQKIYLKREDEFLYTGRRFQIPQGKEVHKIKITDEGVVMVKSDGKTEKIPAVPGEDIETLEGVFFKSVGKKMLINFHNNTGGDLYVITGQKLSFEAHHVSKGENKMIKIKPDWKTKHRFAVAPDSSVRHVGGNNREFSAEYFEASKCGVGDVKIEKTDRELTATLVKGGSQPEEELRKLGAKVFKDKENFTTKDILGFVLKGLQVVAVAALAAAGIANLVTGAEGLGAMGTESIETTTEQFMETNTEQCIETDTAQLMEPEPPMIGEAVQEGLVAPSNC